MDVLKDSEIMFCNLEDAFESICKLGSILSDIFPPTVSRLRINKQKEETIVRQMSYKGFQWKYLMLLQFFTLIAVFKLLNIIVIRENVENRDLHFSSSNTFADLYFITFLRDYV